MTTYKAEKYIRDVELLRNQATRLTADNRQMVSHLNYAIRQKDEELRQIIWECKVSLDPVLADLADEYTKQLKRADDRTERGYMEAYILLPLAILECDLNLVLDILGGSI